MHRTRYALVAALTALSPALAHAQSSPELSDLSESEQREVANLLELAKSASSREEFRTAAEYLERAYALFPHPKVSLRLGEAYESAGRSQEAIQAYARFVQQLPSDPQAVAVRTRIERIRQGSARLDVSPDRRESFLFIDSQPRGAQVWIDSKAGRLLGTTPTSVLPMPSGPHTLYIERSGFKPKTVRVELEPKKQHDEVVRLKALPRPRDPQALPVHTSAAPWVLAGVGAAGVIGAIGFGVAWSNEPDGEASWYETATYVSAGIGVIGLVGAAVLWLAPDDDGPQVSIGPRSVGLGARF